MFEKEAEEFVDSKKSFWRQGRTCIDSVRQAFQKGAEFGYNKANKEIADKQLTKAKEILKGLYFIIESRIDYKNNIEIADEMWRAEQFLSEVEK